MQRFISNTHVAVTIHILKRTRVFEISLFYKVKAIAHSMYAMKFVARLVST